MFIILQKEYSQRVHKRAFILTTLLTPLLLIALSAAPMAIIHLTKDSVSEILNVAVVDKSYKIGHKLKSNNRVSFDVIDINGLEELKKNKDYDAYLYIEQDIVENHKNILLEGYKELDIKTQNSITHEINNIVRKLKIAQYDIENIDTIISDLDIQSSLNTFEISDTGEKVQSSSIINYATGFIGGFLIYIFIFSYGSMVMTSIVDEKSSKVVEVMVSTVTPMQMMLGKVLGIGLVAITQFVIWGILIFIGGTVTMSLFAEQLITPESMELMTQGAAMPIPTNDMLPAEVGLVLSNISNIYIVLKALTLFIVFFVGGYFFYAACFAAVASAVDNLQDVQQLQMPITIPIIASIIFLAPTIEDPNGPIAFWLSIIPFTSPIIMMGRISSSIPIWEIVLSVVTLYASFIAMIWVAGRIYRVGIFMHGKKPSFKDLYKWIKYK